MADSAIDEKMTLEKIAVIRAELQHLSGRLKEGDAATPYIELLLDVDDQDCVTPAVLDKFATTMAVTAELVRKQARSVWDLPLAGSIVESNLEVLMYWEAFVSFYASMATARIASRITGGDVEFCDRYSDSMSNLVMGRVDSDHPNSGIDTDRLFHSIAALHRGVFTRSELEQLSFFASRLCAVDGRGDPISFAGINMAVLDRVPFDWYIAHLDH